MRISQRGRPSQTLKPLRVMHGRYIQGPAISRGAGVIWPGKMVTKKKFGKNLKWKREIESGNRSVGIGWAWVRLFLSRQPAQAIQCLLAISRYVHGENLHSYNSPSRVWIHYKCEWTNRNSTARHDTFQNPECRLARDRPRSRNHAMNWSVRISN